MTYIFRVIAFCALLGVIWSLAIGDWWFVVLNVVVFIYAHLEANRTEKG